MSHKKRMVSSSFFKKDVRKKSRVTRPWFAQSNNQCAMEGYKRYSRKIILSGIVLFFSNQVLLIPHSTIFSSFRRLLLSVAVFLQTLEFMRT